MDILLVFFGMGLVATHDDLTIKKTAEDIDCSESSYPPWTTLSYSNHSYLPSITQLGSHAGFAQVHQRKRQKDVGLLHCHVTVLKQALLQLKGLEWKVKFSSNSSHRTLHMPYESITLVWSHAWSLEVLFFACSICTGPGRSRSFQLLGLHQSSPSKNVAYRNIVTQGPSVKKSSTPCSRTAFLIHQLGCIQLPFSDCWPMLASFNSHMHPWRMGSDVWLQAGQRTSLSDVWKRIRWHTNGTSSPSGSHSGNTQLLVLFLYLPRLLFHQNCCHTYLPLLAFRSFSSDTMPFVGIACAALLLLFLLHSQFKLQAFSFVLVLVMLSLIPFRTWRSFLRSLCRFQKIEWYIHSTKYKYISICIYVLNYSTTAKSSCSLQGSLVVRTLEVLGHYFVYWLVYEFHHFC